MRRAVMAALPLFVAITLATDLHRGDDETSDNDQVVGDSDVDGEGQDRIPIAGIDQAPGLGPRADDLASGLAAVVNTKFAEHRALRGEQSRAEALTNQADTLKSELERSQKEEQEQEELARLSDAAARAAHSKFKDQMERTALQYEVSIEELNRSLASCELVGNRTAAALGQARKELTSERAKLSLLEASVSSSQAHLRRWQQLVKNLTATYAGDRKGLGDALAEEARLRQEVASDEASLVNRTSELRQEREGEHQLGEALNSERQAHDEAVTRAEDAVRSASNVWNVHLKDLSENKRVVSALRKIKAKVGTTQEQWRASDKKLHEDIEADLREARRQAADLSASLRAALAERDQTKSDFKKLSEELAHDRAGARALEKKMRELQGQVDMGRSLVSKGVELIRQCRGSAVQREKEVEQEYEKNIMDMKQYFASGFAKLKHEMHDFSEKDKAIQDHFSRDHDAEEKDKRALEENNKVLLDKLASADRLQQHDEAGLEDLRRQNLGLANANKVLNGNLISQHKALKDATNSLADQQKAQELKNFDTVKALQNENSDLVIANKALKSRLDTERAVLARENGGLADENRALLKVVSELRQQLEAARHAR